MSPWIRLLGERDAAVLDRVAADVFDGPVVRGRLDAFLRDPNHHLIVAVEEEIVVGMVSAVTYLHPDKPLQMWINEMGVAPPHRRRGIGLALLQAMLRHADALGCQEPWLATEMDNGAARALYDRAGGRAAEIVMFTFDVGEERGTPRGGSGGDG